MKAAQLRQSILQAAVQGKLLPQNIHDEPASELLEDIRQEKARLVKDGKIKKEKPLPPIAEDEIPYDLPDGWVWCRLNEVCDVRDGTHDTPKYVHNGIPLITSKNLKNGSVSFENVKYISITDHNEISKRSGVDTGDILFAMIGSIGNPVVIGDETNFSIKNVALFKCLNRAIYDNTYIFLFLRATEQIMRDTSSGGVQSFVSLNYLRNYLISLPPLAEQQRIVAKVDELMVLCDELEAAEKELDALESRFAEYLPKSILQAAVQGKLVPQNIHDEPAAELLKRIQQEKVRLVKEGKIKKEKPLPPIVEDEIPYDLPNGWVWCRLGDVILQNIGGGTPSKQNPDFWNGEIPWASVKDLNCDRLTRTIDTITATGLENSSSNLIPAGSIILCTRMGLGKIAVNEIDVAINQDLRAVFLPKGHVNMDYFIYFYKAQEIIGSGMTVKGISLDELHSLLLPLPPLTEQQRIVAKADELMALCDELKAAKDISIKRTASNIVPFPQQGEDELEIGIAARGEMQGLSDEAARDIKEMFGDDYNG